MLFITSQSTTSLQLYSWVSIATLMESELHTLPIFLKISLSSTIGTDHMIWLVELDVHQKNLCRLDTLNHFIEILLLRKNRLSNHFFAKNKLFLSGCTYWCLMQLKFLCILFVNLYHINNLDYREFLHMCVNYTLLS